MLLSWLKKETKTASTPDVGSSHRASDSIPKRPSQETPPALIDLKKVKTSKNIERDGQNGETKPIEVTEIDSGDEDFKIIDEKIGGKSTTKKTGVKHSNPVLKEVDPQQLENKPKPKEVAAKKKPAEIQKVKEAKKVVVEKVKEAKKAAAEKPKTKLFAGKDLSEGLENFPVDHLSGECNL